MRVTERGDANAGDEVEILAAVDIVQTRPVPPDEGDRLTLIGLQHVARFTRLDLVEGHRHFTTCVQPARDAELAARDSSRTSRPLAITTSPTPRFRAVRQASSLATIPLLAVPILIS